MTRSLLTIASLALLLGSTGCVERRLTVTSEPSNALVYLNGQEWGRTPIQQDFLWYGNYDVAVRAEGYQTLKTSAKVSAPWWQWVPFDFFAEFAWWHPVDRQSLHFTLQPAAAEDLPVETLVSRASELKGELKSPDR